MEYDEVEGVLYGLGRRAEPRYGRPTLVPRQGRATAGSVPLPGPIARRIDVGLGVQRLSDSEKRIVLEHYVAGSRRHPTRIRRPVVKKLLAALRDG